MEFHHNLSVWEIKNKFISKINNYNFSVSFKFFKIKFQKKKIKNVSLKTKDYETIRVFYSD